MVGAVLVGVVLLVLTILLGGARGAAYLALYAAATLPGLPIGRALFGRNAAGLVSGAAIGYGLTALAIWIALVLRLPSFAATAVAWAIVLVVAFLVVPRGAPPLVALPAWNARATAALCGVMLLAPAITGPAYLRIGERDDDGNRRYRAYFTADFVWHEALTAELARFTYPPRNPYMASRPLNYYWAYYLLPATAARLVHGSPPIEQFLAINALYTATLFVALIFLFAWACFPRPGPVAAAVALTVVAASAEGLYAAIDLLRRGRSLAYLRELNIDAISAWYFQGLSIDGLPRSMWYNPQHSLACALGLIALTIAARGGAAMTWRAALAAGLALGLALIMSPFPGGAMILIYAATVLWHGASGRRFFAQLLLAQPAAIAPVALALLWDRFNRTFEGAGGAVAFGLSSAGRRSLGWILLLIVGPVLVPALAGAVAALVKRAGETLRPAIAGLAIALALMFCVTLVLEPIWIGWRAGQVLLVTMPALVAFAIAALREAAGRAVTVIVVTTLFAVGLPTTLIDAYNAQDTSNVAMAAGFRWTVVISPGEQEALGWIERNTPSNALVQMSLTPRGRETWTLIPSFARRRMSAGLPISLLRTPEYDERAARADRIYATTDAAEASRLARELRIDYLYVGEVERTAFGASLDKFDAHPELFARHFQNAAAAVYAVK